MNRIRIFGVSSALLLALWLAVPGGAWSQMGQGMMGHGQGKMMMQDMGDQRGGCPMMMGAGGGRGGMHGGMKGAMLIRDFHRWSNLLMAHADEIGLDESQVNKLEQMIIEHSLQAIQTKAEIQTQQIQLQKALRTQPINMQNVEKMLQSIHNQLLKMQIEGIRLYADVLKMLSPQQTEAMRNIIGTPFPPPWEKMGMKKPGPHHGQKSKMRQQ